MKEQILFVCMENTCRSQMAEGFARHAGLDADSAGMTAGDGVNSDAVAVMAEIGIDISGQPSKTIASLSMIEYQVVISMCSTPTAEICPADFNGNQENWNIDDPKGHSLDVYRRVREEIKIRVEELKKRMPPTADS